MKRNGFTLIELLGVILIIAIIATIITIAIDSNIQKSKVNACKAQEKNIIEAAKTYLTDNPDQNVNDTRITLDILEAGGYIEDLKNPMTNEKYNDNASVKVKYDKGYTYSLENLKDDEKCEN